MRRQRRKKICLAICFLVLTMGIFVLLQNLLMPKYMGTIKEGALVREYYDSPGNHDVIFLGDCEVYESFSPVTLWEEYGIHSYIRGGPSQTIWQSYYLLEDTFAKEIPEVVVFNVLSMQHGETVSEAYNRMNLDGMRWSAAKISAIRQSMTEEETFLSYLFPLLRFHDRWRELEPEDYKYWMKRENVSYNGYLMQTGVKPVTVVPEKTPLTQETFSDICYEYLDKIRRLCEENKVELVLMKAPSLYPYWHEEWEEQIEEYAEKFGLDYYNFLELKEETGIDYQVDTYDAGLHLNVSGAEKLSRYFGKILKERYTLSEHQDQKLNQYYKELKQRYEEEKRK